ncbi:TRAP transporter small permease [Billgrantia sulfidoxydans]|uniref:TRAP transporter small permease protein n=1 Tax=Billgrantia sulfidoxydans TaxID=2733484 RepID=A0ABX7W2T8_9GAMM|nr:TRAP transporter small permease [Halomonas sulfidoxydans]QTP54455.1 TRAP transporter small permease [Halomonas sulfidoxydans]
MNDTTLVDKPVARSPLSKAYHYVMQTCGLAAGIIIGIVSIVIVLNVLSRNLGFGSIYGTVEGSEYAIAAATFLAAPWVLYHGAHVRVDLLQQALPKAYRRYLEMGINLLGALVCLGFGHYLLITGSDYLSRGSMVYKSFVFPEWWTFILPTSCFALLTLEFLRRLWCLITPRES